MLLDNVPVVFWEVWVQELDVEKELTSLIAKVQKGHLIELQEICGDWGPLGRNGVTAYDSSWVEKQQTCKKSPSGPMASPHEGPVWCFWNFQLNPNLKTLVFSYHTTADAWSLSH